MGEADSGEPSESNPEADFGRDDAGEGVSPAAMSLLEAVPETQPTSTQNDAGPMHDEEIRQRSGMILATQTHTLTGSLPQHILEIMTNLPNRVIL